MTTLAAIMFLLSILLVVISINIIRASIRDRKKAEKLLEDASRSYVKSLKMLDEAKEREENNKALLHRAQTLIEHMKERMPQ